ncbi:MAG TPA: hypothetical protein VFU48_13665 [Nitrospira sp.]|jgi:hypothetical protein|nr:hypothetical protein [Nitrospira sp.]
MDMLARMLSKLLVPLFFAGMAGSAFVVIFTLIRDLRQVLPKDDTTGGADL